MARATRQGGTASNTLSISPLKVLLDPKNPRLGMQSKRATQPVLREALLTKFKIEQLAEAIVASGYNPIDPILGIKGPDDSVIVAEGNRRIAALQLLLKPSLAPKKRTSTWTSLSERVSSQTRTQIESVDIRIFPSREDPALAAYIGNRHVTGPLRWPSLEKAGYIDFLVRQGLSYEEIGEQLSSTGKKIEQLFVAYRVALQIAALKAHGPTNERRFGVLVRALVSPNIRDFLGIKYSGIPGTPSKPVARTHIPQLKEFARWAIGTKDAKPELLPESRSLTKFGKLLSSPQALAYIRTSAKPNFHEALARSGDHSEGPIELLAEAAELVDRASEDIAVAKESEFELAISRIEQGLGSLRTLRRQVSEKRP